MRAIVLVLSAALTFSSAVTHADAGHGREQPWLTTWAAAMQAPLQGPAPQVANQTVRQIVRISRGGDVVRVRLSNGFGSTPLEISAASIGRRTQAAGASGLRALRFGGESQIEIPAGAVVLSDPVRLSLPDQADVAISVYVAGTAAADTQLTQSHQTSYVAAGNVTGSEQLGAASTISSWYWLSGVEVLHPGGTTIAALGDSITEGYGSTTDANARWPDVLARRALTKDPDLAVIDVAISGNRVLTDEFGPNAERRLDRDLLTQSGVKFAVLLEGINDIGFSQLQPDPSTGFPPPGVNLRAVSAEQIIAGYKQIIVRAHAAGITLYGATLLPFVGAMYQDDAAEAKRQAVNTWIRTGRGFDGVIDFDAVTRDPADPLRLLPAYDSGDHLHPNDQGYAAMGQAIDLALFQRGAR